MLKTIENIIFAVGGITLAVLIYGSYARNGYVWNELSGAYLLAFIWWAAAILNKDRK